VKDNNDSSYVASFVTRNNGDAKLSDGWKIRESPYSIVVDRNCQGTNILDEIPVVNDNDCVSGRVLHLVRMASW